MQLYPISGPLRFPWLALDAALGARNAGQPLWVIRVPESPDEFIVCLERDRGVYEVPLCQAWFGLFVETDRFTDPVFRINLGPGVWPVEDE